MGMTRRFTTITPDDDVNTQFMRIFNINKSFRQVCAINKAYYPCGSVICIAVYVIIYSASCFSWQTTGNYSKASKR